MPTRIHVSALLLLAALLWGVTLVLSGVPVSPVYLRPLQTVTGVMVIALAVFDLWLWRVPALQGWFVKRPNLNGTWRVQFDSDWKDRATERPIGTRTAYMVVRQTFSTLSMRLLTNESTSSLVAESIEVSGDGTFKAFAVYRNEPKIRVRDGSPIHYGAFMLNVQGSPAERLEGAYWTDRTTRGDMTLSDRRAELCGSYAAAKSMFGD
jgi:hypothetical protein